MKKNLAYLVILIAFLSCDKEEDLPPNNNGVSIKTLSHSINADGGVTLVGEIKNVEIPIDYGFFITTEDNGTHDSYSTSNVKLNTGIYNGNFSIDFKSDLRKGITYYYNTLALKNGEYIYGSQKAFLSNGSASPQIKSIVPNKAHLGDTIVINGSHFSKDPEVYFNTRAAKLLIATDTLIKCIVANNINYNADALPNIELKVKSWTENETIYNEFALHTPRVDSIRPFDVFPGDTITIYGDHFGKEPSSNRLFIPKNTGSSAYPEVIKSSQKELVVIMQNISTYSPTIEIESQNQTIEVKNKFRHAIPEITSLSKNAVKYGEKLVVYGSNFPNRSSYAYDSLRYNLGTKQMSSFETYRDSIVIDILDANLYEDFVINGLSINFFDFEINFNDAITIDEDYVQVGFNSNSVFSNGAVGEDLYVVTYFNTISDKSFAILNKETYRFDDLYPNDALTNVPTGFYFEFHGTKFYEVENLNTNPELYSYDIFTNQKKQLLDIPGGTRRYPFMEVVGDYLYYGLGSDVVSSEGPNDIWRYSFSRNTWEFVLNLPGIDTYDKAKVRPLSFSIGNKIYIGGGQPDFKKQLVDFWEIDTETKQVTQKSDLPITIPERIKPMVINDRAYFDYNSVTYIYNPSNDTWSEKQPGINFEGYNKYLLETEDFVYSRNQYNVIKIKKEYFNQ